MKFIAVLAVLCFCVQGSLQQNFGPNYYQGWGGNQGGPNNHQGWGGNQGGPNNHQGWGGNQGCGGCTVIQGGGGCGNNAEVLILLQKILFHLTVATTAPATNTSTTSTTSTTPIITTSAGR